MKGTIYSELNRKSDFYIYGRVKNNPYKDVEYQQVALQIYKDRDLDSEEKQKQIAIYPKLMRTVMQMFESGSKKSEVLIYLTENGIEKARATSLVNGKFESYKEQLEIERKSKTPWILVVLLVVIIARWVIKISS